MKPNLNAEITKYARMMSSRLKPSLRYEPLAMVQSIPVPADGANGSAFTLMEMWQNRLYEVTVRRYKSGWPFGDGPWAQVNISCKDGQVRHDWRVMQSMKNQLVGEEWEAVELFPAESRLLDPSNMFTLFCAPRIPLGIHDGRRVAGPENCIAPQRGWESGTEPMELRAKQ